MILGLARYSAVNNAARIASGLLLIGGYIGGLIAASSFDTAALGDLSSFFTAGAAVLATLLVALALGAAISDRKAPLAPLLFKIVVCLVVALAASVAGLAPNLPPDATRQLFALTVAGAAVSAFGVLLVAYAAVYMTPAQETEQMRKRVLGVGVPLPATTPAKTHKSTQPAGSEGQATAQSQKGKEPAPTPRTPPADEPDAGGRPVG